MKTKRFYQNKALICGACVLSLIGIFGASNVSATSNVTYQRTVYPEFVLNDSISVSLSSADLVINDLTPGQSADSNIITVTVASNSPRGYKLNSTVGNEEEYKTDTLVHTSGASTGTFANMTTAGALTAGEWGYSYATYDKDNNIWNSFSTYDGLPLYSDDEAAELINTNEEGSTSVQFKIGAYATAQQIAGEYKNIVNFTAVAEAAPSTFYMQDVASWGSSLAVGDEVTAVDSRDNKSYYVAKLTDGNIWMTQNLDHDIVTTADFYTYANTDIGHGATTNTSATWTASRATYATSTTTWCAGGVMNDQGGCVSNNTPESYDPGNVCWDGVMNDDWENADTLEAKAVPCSVPNHYHIGNYYNWAAAVVMNDSSSYTIQYTDADQSVCPAGWRLPTYDDSKSYITLVNMLGLIPGSAGVAGEDGNIQDSPVYFPYAGSWDGESIYVGTASIYWSSVVYDSYSPYSLLFTIDGDFDPQDWWYPKEESASIRCVAR